MVLDPAAPPTSCPNCGAERVDRYCASCGQDLRRGRLRLWPTLLDALDTMFGYEGRVWRTVGGLTTAPGRVVRDYLDGRRARYVHPLRYAVLTCAIWWGVMALVLRGVPDEQWQQLSPGYRALLQNGNWLNLMLAPLATIPVHVAFVGCGRTWLEHLHAMLFVMGHTFLLHGAVTAVGPWLEGHEETVNAVDQWLAVAYLAWALWGLHRGAARGWRRLLLLLARVAAAVAGSIYASSLMMQYAIDWLFL